ncbi:MAG TPA: 16S rRNA (adenine(1518)-N(6)/adenine(1519)-N(6))-dimethyltransferase RsmA [Blastocatellia bacterium]|nr:16S rRNA (adenine(1518)-N(6)/adenine(1519)-N(6))-dimethyltransferase RsmA [Blastocatellia bacterium]
MHARRSLGQNFLTGSHYPERIVGAVNPSAGETIIEIGPGHGALTGLLLERGARVVAIEFDRELIAPLTARFSHQPAFRLIEADALKVDFCAIIQPASTARVVANLPYNVATPILQHLIAQRACIAEMTLMFQREVVERITAHPGGKEYGYLSVLTQFYCEAERLFDVPPGAFRPVPKVMSSVVRLRVRATPAVAVRDEAFFLELTSAIFAQRRKTVLNNLKAARARLRIDEAADLAAAIARAGIDPQRRAETLSLAEIGNLADELLK